MNILFICPNFPVNMTRFCSALGRNGAAVLGIGDAPYQELDPNLRARMTEYYRVGSLDDRAQVLGAASYFKNRYGQIDRIESLQEYWLPLEAALRAHVHAPGRGIERTEQLRRKSYMKECFRKAGLTVAEGRAASGAGHAKRIAEELGYPLVLKPDAGVGAGATERVDSEEELDGFLARQPIDQGYFIEQYIDGELVSYDGLLDAAGNLCFSSAMVFPIPIMRVVCEDLNLWYYTLREVPPDLAAAGQRALKAFELRDSFFHLEFFRCHASGELYALEANFRPPGLLTTDMWNYAYDMDIYEKWARLLTRGTWEPPGERKYFVCYAGRKQNRLYRHSHEEVLELAWPHLVCFEQIPPVYRTVGGDLAYVMRALELERLLPLVREVQAEI